MSAPLDVLGLMDDAAEAIEVEWAYKGPCELREARAAVAELVEAARQAKAAMDSIWGTKGADDQWIYDEMGSELSSAYFSIRAALAKFGGAA